MSFREQRMGRASTDKPLSSSSLTPSSSTDLGDRYMLIRSKYRDLQEQCESAVRENTELRAVMVQILDEKNKQEELLLSSNTNSTISRGVECNLIEFVGQHNLSQLVNKLALAREEYGDGKDKDRDNIATTTSERIRQSLTLVTTPTFKSENEQEKETEADSKEKEKEKEIDTESESSSEFISALVRENQRLLSSFSAAPLTFSEQGNQARQDFSLYIQRKRTASDHISDCMCFRAVPSSSSNSKNENMQIQMGHLFLFKDHLEFISPASPSDSAAGKDWNLFLLDIGELGAIAQSFPGEPSNSNSKKYLSKPSKNTAKLVTIQLTESQSFGTDSHSDSGSENNSDSDSGKKDFLSHTFLDVEKSGLTQLILKLEEMLVSRYSCSFTSTTARELNTPRTDAVVVYENERKAVGWSGKYLLPGDVPNWLLRTSSREGLSITSPLKESPPPPNGYKWASSSSSSEQWQVESSKYLAIVRAVSMHSAASVCGLQAGDCILRFRSDAVDSLREALVSDKPLELHVFRPSNCVWIHAFLKPIAGMEGLGLLLEQVEGWEYAKSFSGPWEEVCRWTHYVRRRRWKRMALKLDV